MIKTSKPSPPTLDAITALLVPILVTHDIEKAILFGSIARRTADRRSDVDLLIVKKTDTRFFDRYEEFGDIYSALARWGLELLVYTAEELARNSDRPFVKTILTEGVTIYERREASH